ncbi:MAG: ferritin-like domain-containing protein [Gammaproteobacteria bacterium]|jgi:bacterioferritin
MQSVNADQRILGYLGRALSMELSAVQLYSTQAKLVENWGLAEVAGKLSAEAGEELAHAERIISRMLALGVAPNASQLRPVRLGRNLQELLQANHAFESEVVRLYEDAMKHSASVGDHDSRLFFEALHAEESQHARHMLDWLRRLQDVSTSVSG